MQSIAGDYLTYFYDQAKEKYMNLCSSGTLYFAIDASTTDYAIVSGDERGYTVVTANDGILEGEREPSDRFVSASVLKGRRGGMKKNVRFCLDESLDFCYVLSQNELKTAGQGRVRSLGVKVSSEFVERVGEEEALVWAVLHYKGLREPSASLFVEDTFVAQAQAAFETYIEPIIRTFDICGTVTRDWYAFLAVAFAMCVDTRPVMMLQLFAPFRRRLDANDLAGWINNFAVDRGWVATAERVTLLANRIGLHQATPSPSFEFNPTTLQRFQFHCGGGQHIDAAALRVDLAKNYAAHLAHVIEHGAPRAFVEAVAEIVLWGATTENIFEHDEDTNEGLFGTFLKTVRCLADLNLLRRKDGTIIPFSHILPYVGGRNISNSFVVYSDEWREFVNKVITMDCFIQYLPEVTPHLPPDLLPSFSEAAEGAEAMEPEKEAEVPSVDRPMTCDEWLAMPDLDSDSDEEDANDADMFDPTLFADLFADE